MSTYSAKEDRMNKRKYPLSVFVRKILAPETVTSIRKTKFFQRLAFIKTLRMIRVPSFFPEYERKSGIVRFFESYKWLFRFGRYCSSYNLYGLDVKGLRDFDDYMDVSYVRKDRFKQHHQDTARASHRDENMTIRYSLLADDKYVFYSYIENMDPKLVPKTRMVLQGKKIIKPLHDENLKDSYAGFMNLEDGKYVCKATIGAFGDSIYIIEKRGDEFIINKGQMTLDELIEATSEEPFLVQDFIKQHEAINKINRDTVNTLRIISTRWNEDTHILAAMLRLGTAGNIVDNASDGGTFVGVDIDRGCLMEYGYYYDRPREKCHPDSKLVYKDYEIPYWEESVALIKELHPVVFGLSTIGWDIAITEDGPVIVEMNWNYSIKGIQIACGGLKKRWDLLKTK